MGKLLNRLEKQLETEYKQDAEDCLKIYNYLKETTGHVWENEWRTLVDVIFKGFPSDKRRYKPKSLGYTLIKGIKNSNI